MLVYGNHCSSHISISISTPTQLKSVPSMRPYRVVSELMFCPTCASNGRSCVRRRSVPACAWPHSTKHGERNQGSESLVPWPWWQTYPSSCAYYYHLASPGRLFHGTPSRHSTVCTCSASNLSTSSEEQSSGVSLAWKVSFGFWLGISCSPQFGAVRRQLHTLCKSTQSILCRQTCLDSTIPYV